MEHPILFSTAMVKAILEGRKTQTRRVIKPQPQRVFNGILQEYRTSNRLDNWFDITCRYGEAGDTLWVRETWQYVGEVTPVFREVIYKADDYPDCETPWSPSIHMPRWASRITLEVLEVRAEHLQAITPEDVLCEGVGNPKRYDPSSVIEDFIFLWDSINAKRGYDWNSNPWVWVVEFRVVGVE